jgi:hypothetical protein
MATEFEVGMLTGLLVGEGHFGGDGRQPQITLRMHVRHESMFHWLERTFPGGRLYGPYDHGGRHYYQWMARGPYLRDHLVPLLEQRLTPELDAHGFQRFDEMRRQYAKQLRRGTGGSSTDAASHPEADLDDEPDVDPMVTAATQDEEPATLLEQAGEAGQAPTAERSSAIFDQLRRSSGDP